MGRVGVVSWVVWLAGLRKSGQSWVEEAVVKGQMRLEGQ